MPWKIVKQGDVFRLFNTEKKKYVNKTFKTRQAALNTKKNYERYKKKGSLVEPFTAK